ncbi:MAG TPA: FeoA family protein [Bacillota bacterium]|nr:FeoA family protein [Bacillota bacterium]
MFLSLSQLRPGKLARIVQINSINAMVERRLCDFGVMEGTIIQLKRTLPFGGPLAIVTKGQSIGIRRAVASKILVECI